MSGGSSSKSYSVEEHLARHQTYTYIHLERSADASLEVWLSAKSLAVLRLSQ